MPGSVFDNNWNQLDFYIENKPLEIYIKWLKVMLDSFKENDVMK